MSIFNRLKLIGLVPIVLLIILSSYFLVVSYINFKQAQTLNTILSNNTILSSVLTEIDKERSLSALYLGSDKEKLIDPLQKQRKNTDILLSTIESKLDITDNSTIPFLHNIIDTHKYKHLLENIKDLHMIRKSIDSSKSDFKKIFYDGYTKKITTPILNNLLQINNSILNTEILSLINTLSQLYTSKENATAERDFVAYFMSREDPMTIDELTLWDQFKTKANFFDLKNINNQALQEQLNKIFLNPKNIEILTKLFKSKSSIITDISTGYYTKESMNWFGLQTKKISMFSKAENITSTMLQHTSDTYLQKQLFQLLFAAIIWLLSFIIAYLGYIMSRNITYDIYKLETVLNTFVNNLPHSEEYSSSDRTMVKNIQLDTHKKMQTTHKFLDSLVDKIKINTQSSHQSNEVESLFLTNISDKIRTSVDEIASFTKTLRNTEINKEQNEYITGIDKGSKNLLNTLNNIPNHLKVDVENIVFDAHKEFESTIESYAVSAAEKDIDLNFYMDPSISSTLKGDATKIKEVLHNLLSNAIKFTSEGEEINLSINKIQNDDTLSHITFSVQDNGIGMSIDEQSHIFSTYTQSNSLVNKKYNSTGLGLTISNQLVSLLGSTLEIVSKKGNGSTFFFSLTLEEIASENENSIKVFKDINIGKYTAEVPTKLDSYLEDIFTHYDTVVEPFHSIKKLKNLIDNNVCEILIVDIDKASNDILNSLHNIDKVKLIIIANITSQHKIDELGLRQKNIIYKPLTYTKIKDTLIKNRQNSLNKNQILKNKENKKILIAKKFLLERKVLIKVLSNLGYTYDSLENINILEQQIASDKYDIIFTDSDLLSTVTDSLNNDIVFIEGNKTKEEIYAIITKKRGA